jgi:hypothetical protein
MSRIGSGPGFPTDMPTIVELGAPVTPEAPPPAAPIASTARPRSAETERTHGRCVTSIDGRVIRDEEWRARKAAHVDRIHQFSQRYECMGCHVLTLLSDVNFSRGVYAECEVMSLVNDYLAPIDAKTGRPASAEWKAYMDACDRGAPELERNRLFFRAHNEALERAKADPNYQAARDAADRRLLTLCDATLASADDLEKELLEPGADPVNIVMGGIGGWMKAHAKAGIMPITMSDMDLVMRATNLNPIERMLDKIRGETGDEPLMARGMRTMMVMQEKWLKSRVDVVRDLARRLMGRGDR